MQGPSEPNCFMQGVLQMDGDEAETGQAIILDLPEFQSYHQLRWLSAWRPHTLPSGGNSATKIMGAKLILEAASPDSMTKITCVSLY